MRKTWVLVIAVLLMISTSLVVHGQNKDGIADPNAPISLKKANAIRHLLELTGSNKLGKQIWDQLIQTVKPSASQCMGRTWSRVRGGH